MLRCAELQLSDEALEGMTMGMVYDMLIEQANDHEQYPYKATQADIDRMFGGVTYGRPHQGYHRSPGR